MSFIGLFNLKIIVDKKDYSSVLEIESKLKDNNTVVLFDNELFIHEYEKVVNIEKMNKVIDEQIKEDILITEDTLLHYEYNKKSEKLYVYYTRGGFTLNKIAEKSKKLKVRPIEFYIRDIVKRRVSFNKNYNILCRVINRLYFINIEEDILKQSKVYNNLEEISMNDLEGKLLILDKYIEEFRYDNIKIKQIKIGEIIDAKLFNKKRLFAK